MRADPVRFEMNGLFFSVPADVFDKSSLMKCWGHGAYGSVRGCTKTHQDKKRFYDKKTGREVLGYCQSKNDPPFLIDGTRLNFDNLNKEGLEIVLEPYNHPEVTVQLHELIITRAGDYALRNYCQQRNSEIRMFGNPVSIVCREDKRPKEYRTQSRLCSFRGLIGIRVKIVQNKRFKEQELPKQYWDLYIREIETLLSGFLEDIPDSQYPEICDKYKKKSNGRKS
jgi:hypothetical protein